MSYWIAYVSSSEPCLLEDVLVNPIYSMSRYHDAFTQLDEWEKMEVQLRGIMLGNKTKEAEELIVRASLSNTDGMGVVWYPDLRPVVYKCLPHPLCDPTFISICKHTSTTACFGHIRNASPLNSREPNPVLSDYNCHPFCRGRYTFMHTGVVGDFDLIRRDMMQLTGREEASWVKGTTDSEAFAALFFTYLGQETNLGSLAVEAASVSFEVLKKTLTRTIIAVLDLQRRVVLMSMGAPLKHTILNLAISNGFFLFCCRFINSRDADPHQEDLPPLVYSTTAGKTLNRKFPGHPNGPHPPSFTEGLYDPKEVDEDTDHGPHVIVASQRTTYEEGGWHTIDRNKCIMFQGRDENFATVPISEPLQIPNEYFIPAPWGPYGAGK